MQQHILVNVYIGAVKQAVRMGDARLLKPEAQRVLAYCQQHLTLPDDLEVRVYLGTPIVLAADGRLAAGLYSPDAHIIQLAGMLAIVGINNQAYTLAHELAHAEDFTLHPDPSIPEDFREATAIYHALEILWHCGIAAPQRVLDSLPPTEDL